MNFFKGFFYENGSPSRTDIISIIFSLTFVIVSCFLAYYGMHWDHYDTFAYATTGGGIGGLVANKYINSAKNSAAGKFPEINKEDSK